MSQLEQFIDAAWEQRAEFNPKNAPADVRDAVASVIAQLDNGSLRVAEKTPGTAGDWTVNQWVKKAVLLSFRLEENSVMGAGGYTQFYDKVPSKFANYTEADFAEGAMIDTWATVGSCAQIGKNVHLSGGVGIGGVLEPMQANPTIIGDNCFIGARSEVVEGVIVEDNSVISMGVYIGQSTKILDRETGEVTYGRIPAGSVVVSGNLPSKDGSYSLYCAVIVKKVDAQTRSKTSINELLRGV